MGRLLGGPCCSLGSSSSALWRHQAEPWPCAGQSLPHPPGELWGGAHRAGFAAAHLNLLLLVWHISPSATCVGVDGAGPGDPLLPPQALGPVVPTKGLVSSWCGSHLRLSKQWILARCAPSTAREDSCSRSGGLRACWAGRPPQSCLAHIPGASHGCSCRFLLLFECWCLAPSLFSSPSVVQSRGWVHLLHVCPLPAPILPSTRHWGTGWSLGSSGLLAPELRQPGAGRQRSIPAAQPCHLP